jgi:hypothetical protein
MIDPDVPTHDHPNSLAAASRAAKVAPRRRRIIATNIYNMPNQLSCWDWCEGSLSQGWGHGAVSGTLSTMKKHHLIVPTGNKKNGRGNNETVWDLNPYVRHYFHLLSWNQSIEALQGQLILLIATAKFYDER